MRQSAEIANYIVLEDFHDTVGGKLTGSAVIERKAGEPYPLPDEDVPTEWIEKLASGKNAAGKKMIKSTANHREYEEEAEDDNEV